MNPRAALDRAGAAIHAIHGTRGLLAAGGLVLLLTLSEPVLPPWMRPAFNGLAVLLLLVGFLTLPRQTAAAQEHLAATIDSPDLTRRLARLLVLPVLLLILLAPRFFLAAYGIPHLTPVAGLLLPTMVRRLALIFLAAVLLIPLWTFQQARLRLAPGPVPRPRDLSRTDLEDDRRELFGVCLIALGVVWLLLLQSFWQPFSLLEWPPSLDSLETSRGITAIAFALVVPATLFATLALHAELLRSVWRLDASPRRDRLRALVALHLLVLLGALALHAYDLLWIAKYQAASGG